MAERTILSFSGDGTHRIEQGPGTIVQAINRIVLGATDGTDDEAREGAAVGFCRFSDPTKEGALPESMAHTEAGLSEGIFRADDVRQGSTSFLSPSMSETICSLIVSPTLWQCYPLIVFGIWSAGEH